MSAIRRLMSKISFRGIGTTTKNMASEHPDCAPAYGYAGSTLPFGINHTGFLVTGFIVYISSGLWLPYLIVRRNLLKAAS